MRYRKPALYAGIGMIFGAVSVAALSSVVSLPPPSAQAEVAALSGAAPGSPETSFDWSVLDHERHSGADAPMVASPRSARQAHPRLPLHPDITLAATGPQPMATDLGPREEVLTIARGDTLLGVLVEAGIERQDAHQAIEALRSVYNPRDLRPGTEVTLTFEDTVTPEGSAAAFKGLAITPDPTRTVQAAREDDGAFAAIEVKAQLQTETRRIEGTIDSSLFMAASQAGVPSATLNELIRLFSYDVDFQRDIQPGDAFAVMYDHTATLGGETVGTGDIAFASLDVGGQRLNLYRYQDSAGQVDYYNEKGQSVRKALLRTPINGARLSSGFGMRKHPILGYSKMHQGIDFAAPSGTPIYAAGDGVIEMAKVHGGYGNYVRVRHTKEWATAYAHLSKYGRGIRSGVRVRQGDVIGYVGSTGRSTGPHLHYEILRQGKQVNPVGVKFPTGRTLDGKELKQFAALRAKVDRQFAELGGSGKLASAR